jgi:hypothetical protein
MNLIEAVKSGKRFRRAVSPKGFDQPWYGQNKSYLFEHHDILATDWEIEERKIEITESQLNQILNEVVGTHQAGSIICIALKRRLFDK